MVDPRRERFGPLLWLRFRAFGVDRPFESVDAFLRETEATDAAALLVESTVYAAARAGTPEAEAARAFQVDARQLRRILAESSGNRLALVLSLVDGLEDDRAGELADVSPALLRRAQDSVRNELAALARPEPDGTQPDSHVSTLDLTGFVHESLGPMRQGQIEQHLASCTACFQRFEVWSNAIDAFAARPPPPPPPPPPDHRAPIALALFAVAAVGLLVLGVVGVVLSSVDQQVERVQFAGQVASVTLLVGGEPRGSLQGVAPNALVQLRFDPRGAEHIGIALRTDQGTDVLLVGPVASPHGEQVAPVELLYDPEHQEALYVVLSGEPLDRDRVRSATAGQALEGTSVAVVRL